MIKKVTCLFLAFLLFVTPAFASSDSSDSSDISTPDALYTASGSVEGDVALSVYLGSSGIYIGANAGVELWQDVSLNLGSLWEEFATGVGDVSTNLQEFGASVVRNGLVYTKKSWNAFSKFGNWLVDKFGLKKGDVDKPLIEPPTVSSGVWGYLRTDGETYVGIGHASVGYYGFRIAKQDQSNIYWFYVVREGGYWLYLYNNNNTSLRVYCGFNTNPGLAGWVYLGAWGYNVVDLGNLCITGPVDGISIYQSAADIAPPSGLGPDGGGGEVPGDEPAIVVSVPGDIDIPPEKTDDDTGGDSLGGVILNGLGTGAAAGIGGVAGSVISSILDNTLPDITVGPAPVQVPPDIEIGPYGDIEPKEIVLRPTDIFMDTTAYNLDISNYFPFSIPFIVGGTLSLLASDPVAPTFTVPLKADGYFDTSITIDLSPFDGVAQICRNMFFLLFCIGLLYKMWEKLG